jgi:hypothetical protein
MDAGLQVTIAMIQDLAALDHTRRSQRWRARCVLGRGDLTAALGAAMTSPETHGSSSRWRRRQAGMPV